MSKAIDKKGKRKIIEEEEEEEDFEFQFDVEEESVDESDVNPNELEDIEWEDAGNQSLFPHLNNGDESLNETNNLENETNEKNEESEKVLTITAEKVEKKKKASSSSSSTIRLTKESKGEFLSTHKTHLLCLISMGLQYNSLCDDEDIKGTILSLLPPSHLNGSLVNNNKNNNNNNNNNNNKAKNRVEENGLIKLIRWFNQEFELMHKDEDSGESSANTWEEKKERILRLMEFKRAPERDLVIIFVALCRVLGLPTRLIIPANPIPYYPQTKNVLKQINTTNKNTQNSTQKKQNSQTSKSEKTDEKSKSGKTQGKPKKEVESSTSKKRKSKLIDNDENKIETGSSNNVPIEIKEEAKNLDLREYSPWVEIWHFQLLRWLTVVPLPSQNDPIIDNLSSLESDSNPFAYVFAYSNTDGVCEVTKRYAKKFSRNMLLRVPVEENKWLSDTLQDVLPVVLSKGVKERIDLEKLEIEARETKEPFPTSQAAFKSHPYFCLDTQLNRYEAIKPGSISLGVFKNSQIYHRSCIKSLHTIERWLQDGKSIKNGEQPFKIVKAKVNNIASEKGNKKPSNTSTEEGEEKKTGLFGEWQTEEYSPPAAENGIVPTNSYGNVYLFKPEMIPLKCVHLTGYSTGILRIAKKLGISAAPAVIGWEHYKGKSHPQIDGVVVCAEDVQLLEEIYIEEEIKKKQQESEKRRKELRGLWVKFARMLKIREYVKKTYSTESDSKKDNFSKFADLLENNNGSHSSIEKLRVLSSTQTQNSEKSEGSHVHSFNTETFDSTAKQWFKHCGCGIKMPFEKL